MSSTLITANLLDRLGLFWEWHIGSITQGTPLIAREFDLAVKMRHSAAPINGRYGNLNAHEAALLTQAVNLN
jgi:hypothetical protein